MFHPNVSPDGTICNEILSDWTPAYTVSSILESIRYMLINPSLEDHTICNQKASDLFKTNRREYAKYANQCVEDSLSESDSERGTIL